MQLLVDTSLPSVLPDQYPVYSEDMKINYNVNSINFLLTKLLMLRKTEDSLILGIDYLSRVWHNLFGIESSFLFSFVFVWICNFFFLIVTDEFYKCMYTIRASGILNYTCYNAGTFDR